MITAFVMISAERGQIITAPDEPLKIEGVTEVYSVTRDFDLIPVVRVKTPDDLAKVVTQDFESSRNSKNQDVDRVRVLQQL